MLQTVHDMETAINPPMSPCRWDAATAAAAKPHEQDEQEKDGWEGLASSVYLMIFSSSDAYSVAVNMRSVQDRNIKRQNVSTEP